VDGTGQVMCSAFDKCTKFLPDYSFKGGKLLNEVCVIMNFGQ
jgi:hypothetical protein